MATFERNQQKAKGIYDRVKAYKKYMKRGMKMPKHFYSPSKPNKKDVDEKDNTKNNKRNTEKDGWRQVRF